MTSVKIKEILFIIKFKPNQWEPSTNSFLSAISIRFRLPEFKIFDLHASYIYQVILERNHLSGFVFDFRLSRIKL